jgi:hypothetical protein
VTQATAINKPTLQQVTIGSTTSYYWLLDGTNDYLQGTFGGGANSQPFTIFAVAKLDASVVNDNSYRFMFDGLNTTNRAEFFKDAAPSPDAWVMNAGGNVTGGAADSDWNIWTGLFNAASSQFWLNGVSEAAGDASTKVLDGLIIGSQRVIANYWKGYIGQYLIYPGNLSTADKNQVGEYLSTVTGIAWTTIT